MRTSRAKIDYLLDNLEAVEKATEFTLSMTLNECRKDDNMQYATARAMEILGEATKKFIKGSWTRLWNGVNAKN